MLTISPGSNVSFKGVPFALSKENRKLFNDIYNVLASDKVLLSKSAKLKHSPKLNVYARTSPEPIAHFEANDGNWISHYFDGKKLCLRIKNMKENLENLMTFVKTPGNNVIAKVEEGELKNSKAENLFVKYGKEFLENILEAK